MIYVISLPSIDTRYTAQWYNCVEKYIKDRKRDDIVLLGNRTPYTVKPTEFLNYRDYFSYAWPQLLQVMSLAKDGDTVFFMDGETAGAEALEYVRKMEGLDIKIRAYWHSGSYDLNDLPYLRNVHGEHFERGWFDIADRIYVGSEYHKKILFQERGVLPDKITVTGSPMDLDDVVDGSKIEKTRRYLFTGRKVKEKGYEIVRDLQTQGVDITVSLDNVWNKDEYHRQIAQTELLVNPSKHELFGFAMFEAFSLNVPCIVPDIPTFETTVPAMYRVPYETFFYKDTFLDATERILKSSGHERMLAEPYEYHKVLDSWFEVE
jgi:glycosyltransferase involved in cell wall biosynthesis